MFRTVPFVGLFRLPQRRTRNRPRGAGAGKRARGRGTPCKYPRIWPYSVTDRDDVRQCVHKPLKVNESHPRCPSMRFKVSTRWIPRYDTACRRSIEIPFVNRVGKISPNAVCVWRCHPLQAVASLTATVFARIQRLLIKRHNPRYAFSLSQLIFECASAYVVSLNDWIIDRFLGITRKPGKLKIIRSLLSAFIAKLDDDQRFVHRQACSQAHWLTSRSKRPRDKSSLLHIWLDTPYGEYYNCACNKMCIYGNVLNSIFPRRTCTDTSNERAPKLVIAGFEW